RHRAVRARAAAHFHAHDAARRGARARVRQSLPRRPVRQCRNGTGTDRRPAAGRRTHAHRRGERVPRRGVAHRAPSSRNASGMTLAAADEYAHRPREHRTMDASRRAFLAGLAATGLAAAAPALAADNRRRVATGQDPQYFFLTLAEAAFLTAFVDELIPADE